MVTPTPTTLLAKTQPAAETDAGTKPDGTPPPGNAEAKNNPVLPASAAPKSPAPFGGHKGGKPTKSGFPVDSKEHAEWLRNREAERSRRRREEAAKLVTPPLPARPVGDARKIEINFTPGDGATSPPADAGGPVPLAAGGPVGPVAGFIAWSTGMLKKPAALAVRIVDRLRKMQLNRRIDKLLGVLSKEEIAEVKKDFEWQEAARRDFEESLAEVSALGLNKAGVSSEYAPFVNLAMSGGELIYAHISGLERLDKMYALKLELLKKEREQQQNEPPKPTLA